MDIYALAIESSCDETSCSIIKNGIEEISTIISTQIDIHKLYGGVVPEVASREHIAKITYVIMQAMKASGLEFTDLDSIAVTSEPGLIGSLMVGVNAAKTIG